jgi:hypothetical protein
MSSSSNSSSSVGDDRPENSVAYLDTEDANVFLNVVLLDYVNMAKFYEVPLPKELFLIDQKKDSAAVEQHLKDDPKFADSIFQHVTAIREQKGQTNRGLCHSLLDQTRNMSDIYCRFKEGKAVCFWVDFKQILDWYLDVIANICHIPELVQRMTISFVLNVIVKNGFFHFVYNGENSRIKVLRNIKAHNNIIHDKSTFSSKCKFIVPKMLDLFSISELNEITAQIDRHESVILFDLSEKQKLSFLLIENPLLLAKKILTLCHVQMFILGLNEKLIISQELFKTYWVPKFPALKSLQLKYMTIDEHRRILQGACDYYSEKTFRLPPI